MHWPYFSSHHPNCSQLSLFPQLYDSFTLQQEFGPSISAESTDPSPVMFAWFHTSLLSHGLTACLVSPAYLSCHSSTVHQTALMSPLDTKLWYLSGCYPTGCFRRKLFGLQKGFPMIPRSPLWWDCLKVSCCLNQSVYIFFHHQNRHQALLSHRDAATRLVYLWPFLMCLFYFQTLIMICAFVLTCFSISFSSNQLSQSNR